MVSCPLSPPLSLQAPQPVDLTLLAAVATPSDPSLCVCLVVGTPSLHVPRKHLSPFQA